MIFVMDATIGQACESQVDNLPVLIVLWFVRGTCQDAYICILTVLYHDC